MHFFLQKKVKFGNGTILLVLVKQMFLGRAAIRGADVVPIDIEIGIRGIQPTALLGRSACFWATSSVLHASRCGAQLRLWFLLRVGGWLVKGKG